MLLALNVHFRKELVIVETEAFISRIHEKFPEMKRVFIEVHSLHGMQAKVDTPSKSGPQSSI
jgi:hypothetical protein